MTAGQGWKGVCLSAFAAIPLLWGCGNDGTSDDDDDHADAAAVSDESIEQACGGPRPPLEDCFIGGFFADCGGLGDPRLACTSDDCRWFSGGCVAEGYTTSRCPEDDICCLDSWPFPPDVEVRYDLNLLVYGWGTEPWNDHKEMNVSVSVQPSPDDLPEFSCTGQPPGPDFIQSPCTGAKGAWTHTDDGFGQLADTLVILPFTDGVEGWTPVVEIDLRGGEQGAVARICTFYFTDMIDSSCHHPKEILCASSGEVTLDAWPETAEDLDGLTGTMNAEFEAFAMEGGFTVTRVAGEGP